MKYELKVEGMACKHCAKHVEEACLNVPGVISAKVDLEKAEVTVESEKDLDLNQVKENITKAGYTPKF